jgi:molybdopterin converting factor small subunit
MRPTSVTVWIPTVLRSYCDGAAHLTLSAPTVADVLARLAAAHPALYRNVCDETGALRRHINVFVNKTHIRDREGLETGLASGDVISIVPAVSGG